MSTIRKGSTKSRNGDNFITPISSYGDEMVISPSSHLSEHNSHETTDLLSVSDLDSISDLSLKEVPSSDNIFIDSMGLDYLVKCAESNRNFINIDRGKESLFVKFDPLYARQKLQDFDSVNTNSVADSSEGDVGFDTGSAVSVFTENVKDTKQSQSTGSIQIPPMSNIDKPMQVLQPMVNSQMPEPSGSKVITPPSLMRSVSAILPPTRMTTDRLVNKAGRTSPIAAPRSPRYHHEISSQEIEHFHSLMFQQEQETLRLRQQNREIRSAIQDMEKNFNRTKEDLESKLEVLIEERKSYLPRENKLVEQLNHKNSSNKQMNIIMEEYQKTISCMFTEEQREKLLYQECLGKVTTERDQALNHLTNMESSFNDLLTKYEKCKSIILESKEKEKEYEEKIKENQTALNKYEELYSNLKQKTTNDLNNANVSLENLNNNYFIEITKLNATVKKHEITIASLQESLDQKTRENEELMKLYEQLISEIH